MKTNAQHRRHGIATIELVLVWPLLLFMIVGVFLMARAGIAKEAAATKARAESYQQRPNVPTGDIFLLKHDPLASQAMGHHAIDVRGPHYMRGTVFEAESFSFTIGRDWNFRDVPFPRLGPFHIHADVLKLIAKNIPGVGVAIVGVIQAFATTMNPNENPLMLAASVAGQAGNIAIRIAAQYLMIYYHALQLAKPPLIAGIAAAFASFQWGLAAQLSRALALINFVQRSFVNLNRASQGLPVEKVNGLGALRFP